MHLRKWLSVLAVIGVLMHAAAIVRHHAVMANAGSQPSAVSALLADLSDANLICHSNGAAPVDQPGNVPADNKPVCPLCSGLAPSAALAAADQVLAHCVRAGGVRLAASDAVLSISRTIEAHSRGPPAA
jgi:hypothetical protein